MVFFANLGVSLHVCLCGDHQVASAQTLDFLDISKKSSFPDWKLGCTGKSFPDRDQAISFPKKRSADLMIPSGTRRSNQ